MISRKIKGGGIMVRRAFFLLICLFTIVAATRQPLVVGPNGLLEQLQSGDTLPLATTGSFGVVKPDGSSITVSGGVITSTAGGSVPTIAALKTLTPVAGAVTVLTDLIRHGNFSFDSLPHVADVTNDPGNG